MWALWAAALFLCAVGLCAVDLFNLLGYESSLVLALLASLAGVRQGVHAVTVYRQRVAREKDGLGEQAEATPLQAVLSCYGRALLPALALLVLPLCVLLLNGLRVRNCNYLGGLQFFVMLPVLSAAVAAAVGVTAGLWTAQPRRALALGYGVVALSLLWAGWRFVGSPAIYAYDPFFGFYPGALYDEDVAISAPFYWARAVHALWALSALTASAAFLDGYALKAGLRSGRWRRRVLAAALVLGAAAFGLWSHGGALGIYTDVASLESFLSGTRVTPHFVIHYRPGGAVDHDISLYAREHELRYEQLRNLLGTEPTWRTGWLARLLGLEGHGPHALPMAEAPGAPRLVSYIFDNYEHKRRWMGAANTDVAKPWRREIYLNHEAWPHPVLRHELAHLFAGSAGDRVLRLAMNGVLPQPGLIEGFAVAADFRAGYGGLLPHQVVKTLREAHLEPPLETVLSLGFWRLPGQRAYAVAGSFCRFLLDRYGAPKLLAVYGSAGRPADFARIYGAPFADLKQQWVDLTNAQPLDPKAREVERERMRRPAVFHKVCAHELAVRKRRARDAAGRGDYDEAVRLLRAVCLDDRGEPQHLAELSDLLWNAGRWDDAEQAARTLLTYPGVATVLQGRAWSRLGDLAVVRGDLTQAAAAYERAEELPSDENTARQLVARRVALADSRAGPYLLSVLVGVTPGSAHTAGRPQERSEAVTVYLLTQAAAASPELGLAPYVLGRMLYQRGGYGESARELARALSLGLPDGRFDRQALMLLGQARLLGGDAAGAAAAWEDLRTRLPAHELAQAAELADYLDRARRWDALPAGASLSAGAPP
jgi:tetratricopeptide (TPR) repeat protein